MFNRQRPQSVSHASPDNCKLASTRAYEGSPQDISQKSPRNLATVSKSPAQTPQNTIKKSWQSEVESNQEGWNELVVMMGQQRFGVDIRSPERLEESVGRLVDKKIMSEDVGLALKIIVADQVVSRCPDFQQLLENLICEYSSRRIRKLESM